MSDRPRRNITRVNYRDLNNGKMSEFEFETNEDLDSSEGGSQEESGEEDMEEGELEEIDEDKWDKEEEAVWLDMGEYDFDQHFEEAKKAADVFKLEFLLKIKEKRCTRLKSELSREKKRENLEKKKKMRELEAKFNKLKLEENELTRSLVTSRSNTPRSTPKGTPAKKRKSPGGAAVRHSAKPSRKTEKRRITPRDRTVNKKGEKEFSDVLSGNRNRDKFNTLFRQAMAASEKIDVKGSAGFSSINNNILVSETDDLDTISHGNDMSAGEDLFKFRAARQDNSRSNGHGGAQTVNSEVSKKQLVELLKQLQLIDDDTKPHRCECCPHIKADKQGERSNKKLCSGRVTKPDESDIMKPVKFAHEKLDTRHVKDRVFDKLSFPLLMAGEMELILQKDISKEEREARVCIARTLSYHKLYLGDEDLRLGYAAVLNKVEQGQEGWSNSLAEDLHKHFEFRANVIWREKMAGGDKNKSKDSTNIAAKDDDDDEPEGKVIYCMEYNKGTCTSEKSHVGKFRGKKVTKWHVCRVCLKANELVNHPEKDCKNKPQKQ